MKALILLALLITPVYAKDVAQATDGKVIVTLTDEDCALPAVSNLANRATWDEKGAHFEGCYGMDQRFGMLIFYFDDRTAVIAPLRSFKPVQGPI